jgi:protein O-GlcNAc transferase
MTVSALRCWAIRLARTIKAPLRRRVESSFDAFRQFGMQPFEETARQIASDGVDILVDLTGHTQDNRLQILAYRPAPVQVSYLGYPGTMGADFIDYIVADEFVVPASQCAFYSEAVVTLPDCYMVSDRKRIIASEIPSRQACGLPAEAFVFCCFNGNQKITPSQFDVWMRILKRVPGSVLWLWKVHVPTADNLRREAALRSVAPERLCFAPRTDFPNYMARHQHAHLFLDTLPYNAHTTANDALWSGVPVVTLPGSTFASRVAGSLLSALGMTELIASSLEHYEEICTQLALDPPQLQSTRLRLQALAKSSPLFDTERFARNLEQAYLQMWEMHQAGQSPRPISVSPPTGPTRPTHQ